MSAADRWGLLGLLAMIKSADPDQALLSVGTDLGTMGLDMQQQGCVARVLSSPSLLTRFAGTCIQRSSRRGQILAPRIVSSLISTFLGATACSRRRQVLERPPHLVTRRCSSCSIRPHETRYRKSPRRSCKQPVQPWPAELTNPETKRSYNRNWRYHKELRIWLTKESGTAPSQKVPGGEQGTYTFWDPDNWAKERKEMVVLYADLEEKTLTAPAPAPPAAAAVAAAFAPGSVQQGPPQLQQMQMGQMGQMGLQPQVRGAFQGVSMAAM